MLLNIDKPHRTSTLHTEECTRIPNPVGTQFKPRGRLGRDGGWFTVASEAEGRELAHRQFERGEFIRCQHC